MMRRLGFLFLALMMVASACGGSDGDTAEAIDAGSSAPAAADDAADAPAADTSETQQADTTDQAAAGDEPAMSASSPIGAFFADDGGFESALEEYTSRVEEEIVLCMAAQGFEFKRNTTARTNPVQDQQNELTEREWTTEYGYGLSTSFDSLAQGQASDPNAEIFLSLSTSEREIWAQTLAGDEGLGGLGAPGSRPLEEQGCIGQAIIATGGAEAIEGIDTFGSAYEEGEKAVFDQKEMVDAVDAWSRCMSEGGHPGYSELEDPEEAITDKLSVITAPLNEALDDLDPAEGQALIAGDTLEIESLPGLDVDALRSLQAEEITVALADLDCYDQEVRMIYVPLRDEFERGLLDEYANEFEALRSIGQ